MSNFGLCCCSLKIICKDLIVSKSQKADTIIFWYSLFLNDFTMKKFLLFFALLFCFFASNSQSLDNWFPMCDTMTGETVMVQQSELIDDCCWRWSGLNWVKQPNCENVGSCNDDCISNIQVEYKVGDVCYTKDICLSIDSTVNEFCYDEVGQLVDCPEVCPCGCSTLNNSFATHNGGDCGTLFDGLTIEGVYYEYTNPSRSVCSTLDIQTFLNTIELTCGSFEVLPFNLVSEDFTIKLIGACQSIESISIDDGQSITNGLIENSVELECLEYEPCEELECNNWTGKTLCYINQIAGSEQQWIAPPFSIIDQKSDSLFLSLSESQGIGEMNDYVNQCLSNGSVVTYEAEDIFGVIYTGQITGNGIISVGPFSTIIGWPSGGGTPVQSNRFNSITISCEATEVQKEVCQWVSCDLSEVKWYDDNFMEIDRDSLTSCEEEKCYEVICYESRNIEYMFSPETFNTTGTVEITMLDGQVFDFNQIAAIDKAAQTVNWVDSINTFGIGNAIAIDTIVNLSVCDGENHPIKVQFFQEAAAPIVEVMEFGSATTVQDGNTFTTVQSGYTVEFIQSGIIAPPNNFPLTSTHIITIGNPQQPIVINYPPAASDVTLVVFDIDPGENMNNISPIPTSVGAGLVIIGGNQITGNAGNDVTSTITWSNLTGQGQIIFDSPETGGGGIFYDRIELTFASAIADTFDISINEEVGEKIEYQVCLGCKDGPFWYLSDGITLVEKPDCYVPCGHYVLLDAIMETKQRNLSQLKDTVAVIFPELQDIELMEICDGTNTLWRGEYLTRTGNVNEVFKNESGVIPPPANWTVGSCPKQTSKLPICVGGVATYLVTFSDGSTTTEAPANGEDDWCNCD